MASKPRTLFQLTPRRRIASVASEHEACHDNQHHTRPRGLRGFADGSFENFALFSCFVNGEQAAAIVAINPDGAEYAIIPLFVGVTGDMVPTAYDGCPAEEKLMKAALHRVTPTLACAPPTVSFAHD